jgi:hypothetical protein
MHIGTSSFVIQKDNSNVSMQWRQTEFETTSGQTRSALASNKAFDIEATIYTKSQLGGEFDSSEQQTIQELKLREMEVKQHEQAHLAAAGQYARGGPPMNTKLARMDDATQSAVKFK